MIEQLRSLLPQRRPSVARHILDLTSDLVLFIGWRNERAAGARPGLESLRLLDVNQAACTALAYSRPDLLAIELADLVLPNTCEPFGRCIRKALRDSGVSVDGLIRFRARDSRTLVTESGLCYLDDLNEPMFMLVGRDITERERLEQLLSSPSHVDSLTGLPNRAVLESRLHSALRRAKQRDRRFAVLLIDVDHFKQINDGQGHLAGDVVLRTVAARLANCLRADDIVVRFGGDEFVALIDDVADVGEAHILVDRILAAIRAPIVIDATELRISVSIGVTIADGLASSPLGLIGQADQGMYRAKALGRDRRCTVEVASG